MRILTRVAATTLLAGAGALASAMPASATIHPLVESYDCASPVAFAHHPLGDVADPPGQTPGYGSHSETSSLRAIEAVTKGFTDPTSPSLSGHKLDGQCGHVNR